ncbi:MAG: hypothetical protein R3300_08735 [Candidatus Promineifilaceae bacterium]|nr:hypothetical protein [Candidatus Promineifilaceae bacterium]
MKTLSPVRPLLVWLCLVALLAACGGAAEVPTRAAAALLPANSAPTGTPPAILSADGSESKGGSGALIPATWTAVPLSQATAAAATPIRQQSQQVPLATSVAAIPTNTPTPTPTGTPTATSEPYVPVMPNVPPTDELGPSKLGLHVIRNNDPAIMEFVRRTQPAVIKAVGDLGFLFEVREASPRTITIGRIDNGDQSYSGSPEEAARRYVEERLDVLRSNPAVDYWEGWNEPDPNLANMTWYARFEAERVRLLAGHGLRAAIGGFATGVPELDEFRLFLPAVEAAKEHGGILSLHEYGAPDLYYLFGSPLPGQDPAPNRGALTFRYRWFYETILEPADLVIPLVISEAGIDGVIGNRPGPEGLGWADFQSYWVEQGLGIDGPDAFINQLYWYDSGVRQDGYVIGFTLFTAGAIGHWKNYDLNPILPELTDYVLSQQ